MEDTLCWRCKNALGGCSWAREFRPVKGWTAKRILVKDKKGAYKSYRVIACPEFTKYRSGERKNKGGE